MKRKTSSLMISMKGHVTWQAIAAQPISYTIWCTHLLRKVHVIYILYIRQWQVMLGLFMIFLHMRMIWEYDAWQKSIDSFLHMRMIGNTHTVCGNGVVNARVPARRLLSYTLHTLENHYRFDKGTQYMPISALFYILAATANDSHWILQQIYIW